MKFVLRISQLVRSRSLLWLIVGAATVAFVSLVLSERSEAQSKPVPKMNWAVTAQLDNPLAPGRFSFYRFEDPEYKVVCYGREKDFSGGFACVKK